MEVDEMDTRMSELQRSEEVLEIKRKPESDEERDDDENMSDSPCESVPSTSGTPSRKTQTEGGSDSVGVLKKAVVVLTRLPEYKINALRPPTPQQFYSEDESLSSSDSDMQCEPEDDSSDSDFPASNKTRKNGKAARSDAPRAPAPQNNNEPSPIIVSTVFAHCSNEISKTRPNLPEEEVTVGMMVVGRRRPMRWQRGKIVNIITKEDGRVKYKVSFEEKGKSLVSGHHIAFDTTPRLEQLYVGARVVVKCQDNKFRFRPAVLGELPSRKNRLRFLVFMDDHEPLYIGLPSLHLVCRPLEDVFEDIGGGLHKTFLKKYMKDWPYPHLTQYKAGQTINVELNGVQQRCEVQVVDCSLIQVVFQESQQKEWVHRGSIRLEHIARFLELKELEDHEDDSD